MCPVGGPSLTGDEHIQAKAVYASHHVYPLQAESTIHGVREWHLVTTG